jgi:DNA-binding beta-propeller fold protein YncE
MYQFLFVALLAVIAVTAALVVGFLRRRPLTRFTRNLLIAFLLIEALLTIAHMLATTGNPSIPAYWRWFFNAQYERNLPTLFSSLQLMLIAVMALINGLFSPGLKLGQRVYWLVVVFVFGFMGIDEFYMIHETFGGYTASDAWELPYMMAGITFFLISAVAWWFGYRRDFYLFFILFAGLGVTIAGGVLFEDIVSKGFVDANPALRWMYIFEELFEMVGATIVLSGLFAYASSHFRPRGWAVARGVLAFAGLAWALWLAFSLFYLPEVEARYLTHSVDVDYDNGLVSLVGYNVQPEVVQPGDLVAVTLYWRANQPLTTDYSVSLHMLTHPDIETGAQSDDLHAGPIPSTAWFPGVVVEKTLYIQTPRNLPAPASYWLTARIWSGPWPLGRPWQDTTGLPVTSAGDLRRLGEDSVILTSVPALPRDPAPAAETQAGYRFSDGFTLTRYSLPSEPVQTHTLPVTFDWATTARPARDLSQFFHLTPAGGGDVITFDQQPFGGRFPIIDWPANARFSDPWQVTLPDDLPPGDYEVRTGLYDVTTLERAAVTDSAGQPVQDNSIRLGTITFAPDSAVEQALANRTPGICYAVSDTNSLNGDERDTIVTVDNTTGETVEIGQTGGIKTEGLTFSHDRSALYAVDERDEVGQFIVIDPQTGLATEVGHGLTTPDNPARNPHFETNVLKDIDSISVAPDTGIVWGVQQDEDNLLFQIDPETGEIIRDAFGEGFDFIKISLDHLPGDDFNNVKDMAIDPISGDFVVIVGAESFDSYLATIDFSTLDLETGTVQLTPIAPPVSTADAATIFDFEALSFSPDGTLFGVSTNNSNVPTNYDMLWQVDPATGSAVPVGQLTHDVDYVDYEAIACNNRASEA